MSVLRREVDGLRREEVDGLRREEVDGLRREVDGVCGECVVWDEEV